MSVFRTRSVDVASVCVYELGADSHVRTVRNSDNTVSIEIEDFGQRCPEIVKDFYGGHATATDARKLLAVNRGIRATLATALRQGGEWRSDD